jgi:hypothetical protein
MQSWKLGSFVGVLALWCVACGGRVDLPVPGAGGAGGGGTGAGGTQAGSGGCPPLPTEPQYDCKSRPRQPTDCPPSGSSVPSDIGYPQGCQVTLPQSDGFSMCGPQRCDCSMFPNADGTSKASWICPL